MCTLNTRKNAGRDKVFRMSMFSVFHLWLLSKIQNDPYLTIQLMSSTEVLVYLVAAIMLFLQSGASKEFSCSSLYDHHDTTINTTLPHNAYTRYPPQLHTIPNVDHWGKDWAKWVSPRLYSQISSVQRQAKS